MKLDLAADNFAGWDRFQRVLNQVWAEYNGSGQTTGAADSYSYTYNQAGDRTSRASALDTALSQTYTYDNLDRLTSYTQGGASNPTQTYNLDALGNMQSADAQNEITGTVAGSGVAAGYDAAGNMLAMPAPSGAGVGAGTEIDCVYDAWDRLVEVDQSGSPVAEYRYDGLNRRVEEIAPQGGGAYIVTYTYFDGQNEIETRQATVAGNPNSLAPQNTPVQYQYVWSLMGVKDPLLRDTYSGGVLQAADRLYYLTDANDNVTAVVGQSGGAWTVAERYAYTPYGTATAGKGVITDFCKLDNR